MIPMRWDLVLDEDGSLRQTACDEDQSKLQVVDTGNNRVMRVAGE